MYYYDTYNNYRNFPYSVTTSSTELAVSLSETKDFLRVSSTDEDTLIENLIKTATKVAEKYTKRDFITKTYTTYRDVFYPEIELRRSPFQSIENFKYYVDSVLTNVDNSLYYTTNSTDYVKIILFDDASYPTDIDTNRPYEAIQIQFKAGYGDTNSNVPQDLKNGLKTHIAQIYENRGDCNDINKLPFSTKLIYDLYKIEEITI